MHHGEWQREERYAETGRWADRLTPAERTAAYVIETWLCDEQTVRYLVARFISRDDLYQAYRRTLSTLDIDASTEFPAYPPDGMRPRRFNPTDPGRVTPQRGPGAGRLVQATPRVFIATASLYLRQSRTHNERGWHGILGWRGDPIYDPNRPGWLDPALRDPAALRRSDRPMWAR